MKKFVTALTILIVCVTVSTAQKAEPYPSAAETKYAASEQTDKLAKAVETAVVQTALKPSTPDLPKITSEEGKYAMFLAHTMRYIVATEANSVQDVQYNGRIFKQLTSYYLTILKLKVTPEEKSIIFEFLDTPLQVKFQEEPYRIDRDDLYRWLNRRYGAIKEHSL